ncbi:hypothetical protein O181_046398 [Austropuccinia psidii MF-1]|uniref:Uncharacterized protein n=1 Tax=Austropuccinia psidii MF-1 TaxID=1389203 RepID=A0A9Q3DTZ5_9BASI|nr:hypothetical protein [Austropuccinia psidii MF-1]
MTPALLPDHLTPLPFLISLINWLLHHLLIISARRQDILPLLPLALHNHPSLCFCTPTAPSDTATPYLPSPIFTLWHPCHTLMISLQHCHHMSTLTHPYASAPPPCHHNFPPTLPPHVHPHPSLRLPCSRFTSDASTTCPPSPPQLTMLTLTHTPQGMGLTLLPLPTLSHPASSSPQVTMLTLPH